ncbi:MAG: TonB-dependent siderophore myxochelin receptor MxcH [Myxococcaceae bacterium]|nr:TonB-dependent siderophore myxochelin receptor MxcH [Myxococcaceae bacterium]
MDGGLVDGDGAREADVVPSVRPDAGVTLVRETVVRGPGAAERLRESPQAVVVVATDEAQKQSADLGEVLARSQGVGVRRGGGLGSSTRFSLNGLTDDQVRFFLDGLPLDLAGWPFGIANVPVNLVERVEVYRGVVPVRFGADALGGAVNLVSDGEVRGAGAFASYQAGSFGTHRLSAMARAQHQPSGLFARVSGFADVADNDYPVDVEVPDQRPQTRGQLVPARVYRFHDGYRALGVTAEAGLVEQPFAKRLLLKGFVNDFRRDLQTNPAMEVPYGEVTFGRFSAGANLRYLHRLGPMAKVDVTGGYSFQRSDFLDVATCIYSWFGRCTLERQRPGEVGEARDDTLREHGAFVRGVLELNLSPAHAVRVSVAPTVVSRDGTDRRRVVSPIAARRALASFVIGSEYQASLFDGRLENLAFGKLYALGARSTEPTAVAEVFRELDTSLLRFGAGDSLRVRLGGGLFAKASYEYATRLPRADELFGDAVLTNPNLGLRPEASHNANLGLTLLTGRMASGQWRGDVNAFLRETENLIVLLPAFGDRFRNENVLGARSLGVEAGAGWTSPGDVVALDLNGTFFDVRNVRGEGALEPFEGDRIPNRPFLFANATLVLQWPGLFLVDDRLSFTWFTRFVGEFFEFWESAGTRESKRTVPSQLLHSAALTYLVRVDRRALSFTGEVQNLTDAKAFDFFGAQRPGRAVFFKVTAEL